jgi:hypothetical protein
MRSSVLSLSVRTALDEHPRRKQPPQRDGLQMLNEHLSLLLHLLHERERPDEQDYFSGLWRGCDFTACVSEAYPWSRTSFVLGLGDLR